MSAHLADQLLSEAADQSKRKQTSSRGVCTRLGDIKTSPLPSRHFDGSTSEIPAMVISRSHAYESSQKLAKSRQNSVGWETSTLDDGGRSWLGFILRLICDPVGLGDDHWANLLSLQDSNFKRFVEVGRVVLINNGPLSGKIAVIAEIIDHNRAIIDGPSTGVPRQAFPYKHLLLTPIKLTKLPRGAGSGVIQKFVEKEGVVEKWDKSAWAQKRATREKRRSLNDFDRFKVMLAKKQRRDVVRKALKKASA